MANDLIGPLFNRCLNFLDFTFADIRHLGQFLSSFLHLFALYGKLDCIIDQALDGVA